MQDLFVWNQTSFRRTTVHAYQGLIKYTRPLINQFSRIKLPPTGAHLPFHYLHSVVCQNNDPSILKEILSIATKSIGKQGCGYAVIGLDKNDSLNQAMQGLRKRTFYGKHFLVSFADNIQIPKGVFYFDAARI